MASTEKHKGQIKVTGDSVSHVKFAHLKIATNILLSRLHYLKGVL